MMRILFSVLATIGGLFLGGMLNGAILFGGGALLPPPEGVDVNNIESINAHIHEYSVLQLMVPFAAHAAGTLLAAFLAARFAPAGKLVVALVIGGLFLAAGISAVIMISNSPLWFSGLDLIVAYIPMALLGWRLALATRRPTAAVA